MMRAQDAAHVSKYVQRYLNSATMEKHLLKQRTNVIHVIARKLLIHALQRQ